MEFITFDNTWLAGIPQGPTNFDVDHWRTFRDRLQSAYQYSKTTPFSNEHACQALTVLARFGLVVEKSSSLEGSSVPLSKYIGDTLLNFSLIHQKPCEHGFFLKSPSGDETNLLRVPARSHLLLLCLAEKLQIQVYLFSSRSRSRLFTPRGATASEYSIGFFYNVDSYHTTGEYLILAPSARPLDVSRIPTRQPASPKYSSSIPVALFKSEKGKGPLKRKRPQELTEELTKEDCVTSFKTAWYVVLLLYFF